MEEKLVRFCILCFSVALLAVGCGPMPNLPVASLHPLYTDKDLVADPAMEGEWIVKGVGEHLLLAPRTPTNPASASSSNNPAESSATNKPAQDEIWAFMRDTNHDRHYLLTITTANTNGLVESRTNYMTFDACLLRLAGSRYLNLKLTQTDIFGDRFSIDERFPNRGLELLWGSLVLLPAHCYLQVF